MTAPPASEPFDLDFVKNYLKVDGSEDDALITRLIKGARSAAEVFLNMALLEQTIQEQIGGFPGYWRRNPLRAITLKRGPAISVDSISYYDTDGNQQSFNGYSLRQSQASLPVIAPLPDADWPETPQRIDAVTIEYRAGFADADSIHPDILDAILMMVADSYDNRTDSARRYPAASRLKLQAHRLDAFFV